MEHYDHKELARLTKEHDTLVRTIILESIAFGLTGLAALVHVVFNPFGM